MHFVSSHDDATRRFKLFWIAKRHDSTTRRHDTTGRLCPASRRDDTTRHDSTTGRNDTTKRLCPAFTTRRDETRRIVKGITTRWDDCDQAFKFSNKNPLKFRQEHIIFCESFRRKVTMPYNESHPTPRIENYPLYATTEKIIKIAFCLFINLEHKR